MITVFFDKNILFHYMRKLLFTEKVPLSSLVLVKLVHKKKISVRISENALFGLMNYCVYKLQRQGSDEKEAEKKVKEKIRYMLQGQWNIVSIDITDTKKLLEDSAVPFEDHWQYLCAQKAQLELVTHNVIDFDTFLDVKVTKPRDFLDFLQKKKIITEKDRVYP
jgi:hypothetical protein